MASNLVFPDFVVGHFFRPRPSRRCGKLVQSARVRYPTITRRESEVHLRYPATCGCGCAQSIHVRMPVLFFGYVVARFLILDSDKRAQRSKAEMQVVPRECSLLHSFARDFRKLMDEQLRSAPDQLTDVDRYSFEFDEQEWADFTRRLGFGEDQENQKGEK